MAETRSGTAGSPSHPCRGDRVRVDPEADTEDVRIRQSGTQNGRIGSRNLQYEFAAAGRQNREVACRTQVIGAARVLDPFPFEKGSVGVGRLSWEVQIF